MKEINDDLPDEHELTIEVSYEDFDYLYERPFLDNDPEFAEKLFDGKLCWKDSQGENLVKSKFVLACRSEPLRKIVLDQLDEEVIEVQ